MITPNLNISSRFSIIIYSTPSIRFLPYQQAECSGHESSPDNHPEIDSPLSMSVNENPPFIIGPTWLVSRRGYDVDRHTLAVPFRLLDYFVGRFVLSIIHLFSIDSNLARGFFACCPDPRRSRCADWGCSPLLRPRDAVILTPLLMLWDSCYLDAS
ncbi:hypothetical protein ASPBRDRAFT_38992 [Aspergillus brasiliensis CBS 101740]|uniref:Uncharacterized protein n=1 Tax=Aspergillus brasiliensis (strain CBS 101740 / IMI 381727 / IBT 21946) TaxID=767769 RepID=A0A1L9UXS4_ASPBC|nr:hypothetical protein ASPBRDRAFT_38992 [Aspergillus brasiliensis CBS 101740]